MDTQDFTSAKANGNGAGNGHQGGLAAFAADEAGVTAIEYGLIAGLISVVIIVAVSAVGTQLVNIYNAWSAAVLAAL